MSLSHPGCIHVELPKSESRIVAHEDNDRSMIEIVVIKTTFLKVDKSKYKTFFTLQRFNL